MTICVMCAVLTACVEPDDHALRFGLASMPVTLDPRFATDAASARIVRLLYRQLTDFDDQEMPVPALAAWERVDARHYRFVLREGRSPFSDGHRVRAEDVKATYDSVLDAATASPHRASLANVDHIETDGENAVDFYLRDPDILFPGRLTIGILPARLIRDGHPFGTSPVGSGPFELESRPAENRLKLRRRRDGQEFEFVGVPDPTVRVLKLLRGEVDMLQNDLPPEMLAFLDGRNDATVTRARGTNFAYLGFNLQDPVVGRLAVRRAIAMGVDRESIIRYVLGAAARPANALLVPNHWAGDPGLTAIDYDPIGAMRLLKEAGYGAENRPRIVYKTSTDPFRLRLATIIQYQLSIIGIDVELRSYDWGTFYGDIKQGNFQMFSLMWVGVKLPDIFRYAFDSDSVPPQGANRGRYSSPVADALIRKAESAESIAGQAVAYRELQALLLEDLPYVPLWHEDQVFVARPDIVGYRIASDGNYDGLVDVHRVPRGQTGES